MSRFAATSCRRHGTSAVHDASSRFELPENWWVIKSPSGDACWNMAFDEALMERARLESVGILRIYSWSRPAISFGRNEVVHGRYDAARLTASGYDLVRRPTGGRALLHVHEITYAIALPLEPSVGWRQAYDAINSVLYMALRPYVDARIVQDEEFTPRRPERAICFTAPAAGEIVVGDAKLVASAVWRDRSGFLQQGSILTEGDQEPLRVLGDFDPSTVGEVATLAGLGAPTDIGLISQSLTASLSNQRMVIDVQPDATLQRDAELRVNHFRDPSWLWRR